MYGPKNYIPNTVLKTLILASHSFCHTEQNVKHRARFGKRAPPNKCVADLRIKLHFQDYVLMIDFRRITRKAKCEQYTWYC